jgi:heme-degrading monooxygenase HmoA
MAAPRRMPVEPRLPPWHRRAGTAAACASRQGEDAMIAVYVTFRYGSDFDEAKLHKVAASVSGKFVGMPGLRQKAFTVNAAKREATNVYLWQSEEAARAFFNEAMLERVTGIYGVRPTIEFAAIAELVDNH